ncbi:MAG: stage III sporulation protein AB [Clostridia bacterium]|nr:stage III sporulation protein AB [Clostridia bacterium]
MIGVKISNKYAERANNLKQIKKALNIFEAKITYTYEPIPDVFLEISKKIKGDVGKLFFDASRQMQLDFAGEAWEKCINNSNLALLEDDKESLKSLGKLLGNTDIEGQISQLRLVNTFLDSQIEEATESRNKNEKMYKKLGIIVGLAVVIVLV